MLWYLPIIPRFKYQIANRDDKKNLTWHADGRNYDGMFFHLRIEKDTKEKITAFARAHIDKRKP